MRLLPAAALALCCSACIVYAPTHLGAPPVMGLVEAEITPADGYFVGEKIALLPIEGTIVNSDGGLLGAARRPVATFVEQLDAIREDDDVRAVVLCIDSPGGSVTASDQMHRELLEFKRDTGLPVIAALADVAASGAYYVAVAADEIIAHPTSITGSIGVLVDVVSVEGLFDKIGLEQRIVRSGPFKDMGSPYRPMTDAERAMLQHIVDALHTRFVDVVAAGRSALGEARVRELADGRVYTAEQALELGLVDDIGYLDDAIDRAMAAAGIDDAKIVTWRAGLGFRPNPYGVAAVDGLAPTSQPDAIDRALDELLPRPGARVMYLWVP